jgi:Mce-associated membrane protein
MKADAMNESEPQLTSPETHQPRARSGLAKLRGSVGDPVPATPVATPPESSTPPSLEQASGGVVTLTKADPVTPADTQPDSDSGGAPARKGPGRAIIATLVALVVAIAALVPLVLINGDNLANKSSSSSATGPGSGSGGSSQERLAVVRAARQFTVSFFTYDYRKIDTYFKRIEAASSGAFRKDFVSKEATLKTVVTQLKTVATGQVPDAGAGLFQLNGDKATALIAANFNASNAVTKNGQKRYRVKIALQRIKGTWLVTNFDQVV